MSRFLRTRLVLQGRCQIHGSHGFARIFENCLRRTAETAPEPSTPRQLHDARELFARREHNAQGARLHLNRSSVRVGIRSLAQSSRKPIDVTHTLTAWPESFCPRDSAREFQ